MTAATPGGVALGLLGAGVVYLLAKGKEKSAKLDALEQRMGPRPRSPAGPAQPPAPSTEIAPEEEAPTYTWQPDASVPPLEPSPAASSPHAHVHPRHAAVPSYPSAAPSYPPLPSYPQHAPGYGLAPRMYPPRIPPPHVQPSYPPAPAYPAPPQPRHGGAPPRGPGPSWVRATHDDVKRDGVTSWYLELLNSSHPTGYSEQRVVGGRHWKLTVVSAATDPQLTQHARDVIGWVIPGPSRQAPPPPTAHAPHAYPPPHASQFPPHVSSQAFAPPSQVPYAPAPQVPYGGGPPPWPAAAPGHPGRHDHGVHPTMAFSAPESSVAPTGESTGECKNWRAATDADVHQDGVATVYQSMLSLPETSPARIEVHKGRTWKFQVVTPTSDPSFGFPAGVKKSVRGWVCTDTRDTGDPGY